MVNGKIHLDFETPEFISSEELDNWERRVIPVIEAIIRGEVKSVYEPVSAEIRIEEKILDKAKDAKIARLEWVIENMKREQELRDYIWPIGESIPVDPRYLRGKIAVGPGCCHCGRPGEVRYY